MKSSRWDVLLLGLASSLIIACGGVAQGEEGGSSGGSGAAGTPGTGGSSSAGAPGSGGAGASGASGTSGASGASGSAGSGGGICPDPNDPLVHYVSQDPQKCELIDFGCPEPWQKPFVNACGCGCIGPVCPDPNDPNVSYVVHSQEECAAIDFVCEPGQTMFSSECGCGCIASGVENCAHLSEQQCEQSLVCSPTWYGLCDCACPNGEHGCETCPPECFSFQCTFAGE